MEGDPKSVQSLYNSEHVSVRQRRKENGRGPLIILIALLPEANVSKAHRLLKVLGKHGHCLSVKSSCLTITKSEGAGEEKREG